MTNHPIERLRNKLTPFLNLVNLLTLEIVKIECPNETLKRLIEKEIDLCAENVKELDTYLSDAENIIEKTGFVTKQGLDYKTLSIKFDEFMSMTKEEVEAWIEMDRKREENAQS